jgi:hypothetical protein
MNRLDYQFVCTANNLDRKFVVKTLASVDDDSLKDGAVYTYLGVWEKPCGAVQPVCLKYTDKKRIRKWQDSKPIEVVVLNRLYYCLGVSQLVCHYNEEDRYCIITEKPDHADCMTLDELIKYQGKEWNEGVDDKQKRYLSLSEANVKRIFKQVLDIVNACYLRGVRHMQLHEARNYWIDLMTYEVKLWNFEHADVGFTERTKAIEDEWRVVRQLGILLQMLTLNINVSQDCLSLIKSCLQKTELFQPTLKYLRRHFWFVEKKCPLVKRKMNTPFCD